jgi:hypothetical protein
MLIYLMAMKNIWRTFGIFYDHFLYFVFIWYIFSGFGIVYQEKSGNLVLDVYVNHFTSNRLIWSVKQLMIAEPNSPVPQSVNAQIDVGTLRKSGLPGWAIFLCMFSCNRVALVLSGRRHLCMLALSDNQSDQFEQIFEEIEQHFVICLGTCNCGIDFKN